MAVYNWLKRYQEGGLAGLTPQAGRGRKAILQTETDLEAVRQAVRRSRQRISLAKAELEYLGELEGLSQRGQIELLYGDESRVSLLHGRQNHCRLDQ